MKLHDHGHSRQPPHFHVPDDERCAAYFVVGVLGRAIDEITRQGGTPPTSYCEKHVLEVLRHEREHIALRFARDTRRFHAA